jgi:hypothetical protein
MNYFNVFMSPYGDDGGSGGSGGDEPNILNLTNFSNSVATNYVESPYLFTDPPRYYKANDPYYYEVDNIPLKQIHENCLWLKDQIAGVDTEVSGIPTRKIIDLQPFVSESDRVLKVRSGKFTARINDAFSTNPNDFWATFETNQTVDFSRSPIYKNPSVVINNSTFSTLVGDTVNQVLYNNGLYDHYQHYPALMQIQPAITSDNVPFGPINLNFITSPSYLTNAGLSIAQMPKIRAAVWKQKTDTDVISGPPYTPDLQQLSVDFCRRWQGVFRTSVVNSANTLSITVPPFNADDYLDANTTIGFDPQVRIDLVFMYAHPVDSAQTHIAKQSGEGPERITMPRLGMVKGAGAILTPNSLAGPAAVDITTSPSLINSSDWNTQATNNDKYYSLLQNGLEGASLSIQSTLSDQLAANSPFNITTGASFPSPDDLLNLAPLLSQNALDGGLQTVGQSVLPICYVVVKKDSPLILEEDIIDIRPFLRTTELTYNERAGVAAANPPLSLANPATGKYELYNSVQGVRDYLMTYIQQLTGQLEGQFSQSFVVPKPILTCCLGTPSQTDQTAATYTSTRPSPIRVGSDVSSLNNNITNYPEAFNAYNTDTAILANTNGVFFLIPGIYDLDWSCTITWHGGDASTAFECFIADTAGQRFPGTSTWGQFIRGVGPGNQSAGGSDDSMGMCRVRGTVTITQEMFDNNQNQLQFAVDRVSSHGGGSKTAQGGVATITRLQNTDGTEGTIK